MVTKEGYILSTETSYGTSVLTDILVGPTRPDQLVNQHTVLYWKENSSCTLQDFISLKLICHELAPSFSPEVCPARKSFIALAMPITTQYVAMTYEGWTAALSKRYSKPSSRKALVELSPSLARGPHCLKPEYLQSLLGLSHQTSRSLA